MNSEVKKSRSKIKRTSDKTELFSVFRKSIEERMDLVIGDFASFSSLEVVQRL